MSVWRERGSGFVDPAQELARIQRWLGKPNGAARISPIRCEELRQMVSSARKAARDNDPVATTSIKTVVPFAIIGMVRSYQEWVGFETTALVSSLHIDAATCRCRDLEMHNLVNNWKPQEEELILADMLRGWTLITSLDESPAASKDGIPTYRSHLFVWKKQKLLGSGR